MALDNRSFKTHSKYLNFTGFSPVVSLPYLPKCNLVDFNLRKKSLPVNEGVHICTNNLMHLDLVSLIGFPGFCGNYKPISKLSEMAKSFNPVNNVKKFESFSHFSTMNILSYLVGGFVGSKSQIGCTSMQGDRFQIWDLVWQKLLEIMGSSDNLNSTKSETDSGLDTTERNKVKDMVKQSYADVTKIFPEESHFDDKSLPNEDNIRKDNMKVEKKRKRKRITALTHCYYKDKNDLEKYDKKFGQESNSFCSSRWSNSRKKHGKKGTEKINKRDTREAARDGLDFIKSEINSNSFDDIQIVSRYKKSVSCKTNYQSLNAYNGSSPVLKDSICLQSKNKVKHDNISNFDSIRIKSSDDNNSMEIASVTCLTNDGSLRHRISSICSVDSDDSFIIFDASLSEEVTSQLDESLGDINFSIHSLDYESDSLSSSSSSSDIDDDSINCDDPLLSKNVLNMPCNYKNELGFCCWISNHVASENVNTKNKNSDDVHGNNHLFNNLPKLNENKPQSDNVSSCLSLNSIEVNVPFVVKNCGKIQEPADNNKMKQLRSYFFKCNIDLDNKSRSMSESSCDSDDSFIIFDSPDIDDSLIGVKSETMGQKLCCDSLPIDEDSDEDLDEIDSAVLTPYALGCSYETKLWLEQVNSAWEKHYNNFEKDPKLKQAKKVNFPSDDKLTSVRRMVTWDYALRAARVGAWEQLARDTMRFQNRIRCIGEALQSILVSSHRDKIWKERFCESS